jgi:hypothetical protein
MRKSMHKNRRQLYGTTALWGSMSGGRLMKSDDRSGVGATGENNQSGNSGESGASGNAEDNSGQGFDAKGFWEDPEPSEQNNGTPTPTPQQSQQEDPGQSLGAQLQEGLKALKFNDLFDDDIAKQINEGDLTGANARFGELARDMVKQSVVMNTKVVQAFGKHMMTQMESMINDRFGGEKNDEALLKDFPSAKNPAVYKTIKPIFDKALKNTKGDRESAVAMTKDMIKFIRETTSKDLGLEESRQDKDDFTSDSSRSLVDSLLSMN